LEIHLNFYEHEPKIICYRLLNKNVHGYTIGESKSIDTKGTQSMKINTSISAGDFLDRLSILEIKKQNGLKVDLEINEYLMHVEEFEQMGFESYKNILKQINLQLWNLEDIKRTNVERYSTQYSNVSTLITQLNDLRYQTKKKIDVYFGSEITEMKSHENL
jgi:hypothetical protein